MLIGVRPNTGNRPLCYVLILAARRMVVSLGFQGASHAVLFAVGYDRAIRTQTSKEATWLRETSDALKQQATMR